MKILYAVQATGNGHISRALELLPYLKHYGEVDIFLSGDNSHLEFDMPIKYRSRGISLYYNCKGGLDYWQLISKLRWTRVRDEIKHLPVEKYDLILNDFDHITSAACARKGIQSIHFGHQASFQSEHTPRPARKNQVGEWLLKNYVKATNNIGLHFENYDDFILTPVIKKSIREAVPMDYGHVTVYLPSYCEPQLRKIFNQFPSIPFQIFSKEFTEPKDEGHIRFLPVNNQLFNASLVTCYGVITGGGFETPSETIHLGKKLMVIPINGQYEQQCNAAALHKMGITWLTGIDSEFNKHFYEWLLLSKPIKKDFSGTIPKLMEKIFESSYEWQEEKSQLSESF